MFILKKKSSIVVDAELWKRWINFVVSIHGSTRRISEEIEKAMLEYMMKGSYRVSADELRKYFGITEVRPDIEVPEGLEKRIREMRRKRVYM